MFQLAKVKTLHSVYFLLLLSFIINFCFPASPALAESGTSPYLTGTSPYLTGTSSYFTGSSPYLIGANDILNIFVWKEPDLTRDVFVMPDGRITYPLIGEVEAEGQTITKLREQITKKLESYVSAPEVTVIVKDIRSRPVYVIGKVKKVGPYNLEPDMTVLQALSMAGGFDEWADQKNILVIRRGGGKEIQIKFNYKEFISGQHVEQNIKLEPKDTIVIP